MLCPLMFRSGMPLVVWIFCNFVPQIRLNDAAVLTFNGASSNWAYLKMMGFSETVGGINDNGFGVIENTESEIGITTDSVLTIVVPAATTNTYTGWMRDRAGGTSTGKFLPVKAGLGTLVLNGTNITYSGNTTIS